MRTNTETFHSMKGHVSEGCEIVSPSGKVFTLKNTMRGWMVFGEDGLAVSGNLSSCADVEMFVVRGLSAR